MTRILKTVLHASAVGVSIAVIGLAPALQATTLRRMSLPDIVRSSERVVHARAINQRVYWDDEYRRIWTDTTFEVLSDVKGKGDRTVTVTMPGGRIGKIAMVADGTPQFTIGEEVILFATPRPDGRMNLVGFSQGHLAIQKDPVTGDRVVTGVRPRSRPPGAVERPIPSRPPRRAPLSEVIEALRDLVQAVDDDGIEGRLDSVPSVLPVEENRP